MHLKLLDEYDIPHGMLYEGTVVGGLSGIDFNAEDSLYYLICDDRSYVNPTRFYTARIHINGGKIDTVLFTSVKTLLRDNGAPYTSLSADAYHSTDPEAIRFDPVLRQIVWSSEGERRFRGKDTILIDPGVTYSDLDGRFKKELAIPGNLHATAQELGPRQNVAFEGLTFSENRKRLYVSVEEPLYEDGPLADTVDKNAYTRILEFDVVTGKPTKQYAYKLETVAYPPTPSDAYRINGISEILSLRSEELLVMERSFSVGRLGCTIRLYHIDLAGLTDVSGITGLSTNQSIKAAKKSLILNMDSLGRYVDNVEGITFGPRLPNGHRTLLLIADNNFEADERSQVWLFEVLE